MVQPVVTGIQSQGVIANVKHYAMNSQETNRHGVSAVVDERTRFEIYYPPFGIAATQLTVSPRCRIALSLYARTYRALSVCALATSLSAPREGPEPL
jgi:beta-glucosidase-like glycosyl hydrolase